MDCISRTVELLGAALTAYGLAYAYRRATENHNNLRTLWAKLRTKFTKVGPDVTTSIPAAQGFGQAGLAAGTGGFEIDPTTSVDDRLESLADQCRELQKDLATARLEIGTTGREIRKHSTDAAAQARADARTDLQEFGDSLDKSTALDLRLAIAGVLINSLGVFLGYWA
ncbi:hypothetical protein ACHIPZ_04985 [Antrihabitans sp. NCIMB 15449]|uniref:DUF1640 domain-containing protein n=1 Tax=Antrihabitans spumae TaxID=3373370 RepID=A0ABW7JI85_9NOCA